MNAQHSALADDWGTPPDVIELVRTLFGGTIDLDPASNEEAQKTVRAITWYCEADNSLSDEPWDPGSVFLNPPGGKIKNRSKPGLFWERLLRHRACGLLSHAVFLAFSAESLQNTQGKDGPSLMDFPICVPKKRLRFVPRSGQKAKSPTHANVLVYVPGTVDRSEDFQRIFSVLGAVKL